MQQYFSLLRVKNIESFLFISNMEGSERGYIQGVSASRLSGSTG